MNITAEEYTIFMLYGGTIFKFLSFFLYLILVLDICMRIKNINCHNIIPFFFFLQNFVNLSAIFERCVLLDLTSRLSNSVSMESEYSLLAVKAEINDPSLLLTKKIHG